MITIHRKEGDIEVLVSQGSVRRYNLMKDDYIKLKFSLSENVPLLIGDYVDLTEYFHTYENELYRSDDSTTLFVVGRNYYPTYNKSTGGYDYDVQIDAYYKQWDNFIMKYTQSGNGESSFVLTDNISVHAGLIVRNLDHIGMKYGEDGFMVTIDPEVSSRGMKNISYGSVSVYGALYLIADAFECEWWVVGREIHFGFLKDNSGSSEELTLNVEIADASTSKAEGTYATRLYAFGGTTNVPKHYRDRLDFTVTDYFPDSLIDKNKPIKATWFTDTISASVEELILPESKVVNDIAIRDDEYRTSETISFNRFDLKAQEYDFKFSSIAPKVSFRKLLVHGSENDEFSIDFRYGFRLVRSTGKIDLVEKKTTLTKKVSDLYSSATAKSALSSSTGYLKETSDADIWEWRFVNPDKYLAEQTVELVSVEDGKSYVAGATIHELLREKASPFFRNANDADGNLSALSNKNSGDITFTPIVPVADYSSDKEYTIYLGDYAKNERLARYVKKRTSIESLTLKEASKNVEFQLEAIDFGNPIKTVDIDATYTLEFYIEVSGTSNIVWFKNNTNPMVLFDVTLPQVEFSYQRTALGARTEISYTKNGETKAEEVIVNPDFLDDSHPNHSYLEFVSGRNPLAKGDVYNLPHILRSKVSENNGEYFSSANEGVQTAVVQKNIMMPVGTDYVQAEGVQNDEVVEAVVVYDWIYPKTVEKITKVEDTTWKEEDSEIPTYRITIGIKNFKWDNFVTDGENLYVIFQSGKASGIRFKVDEVKELHTDTSATFVLVPNEDYGVVVPNEATVVNSGDTIIFDGIDVQYFDMNAIERAEEEVKAQAEKDLVIVSKENKVVDVTMRADDAYNRGRIALGSIVQLNGILNEGYESRIIGFEEKLDIPYDSPKYIIGESNYYSRSASIESKLEEVNQGSPSIIGGNVGGGTDIRVIKRNERTEPSDNNVFSALRVESDYLNKNKNNSVNGEVYFGKGISVAQGATVGTLDVRGNTHVGGNVNIEGNQEVKGSQTLYNGFKTANFSNVGGSINGAQLTANGILTVHGLKATSFEVYELVLNKVRAQSGEHAFSASGTIEYCEYEVDGKRIDPIEYAGEEISYVYLTIKKDEVNTACPFVTDDILYGNVNEIEGAKGGQCVMHVVDVDGMVVKAELYPVADKVYDDNDMAIAGVVSSNIPPVDGMAIAQRGNEKGGSGRNTAFFISTSSANIYMLSNITKPTIDRTNYATVLGQLPTELYTEVQKIFAQLQTTDPVVFAKYGIFENLIQYDQNKQPIQRESNRGEWDYATANNADADKRYKNTPTYYDTVSYGGSLYKCLKSDTTERPDDGTDWAIIVSKGDKGEDFAFSNLFLNSNFDKYDSDNVLSNWETYTLSNIFKVFPNDYQSFNAIGGRLGSEKTLLKQTVALGKQTYVVSVYCKQGATNSWLGFKSDSISSIEPIAGDYIEDTVSTADYDVRYKLKVAQASEYTLYAFRFTLSSASEVTISLGIGSGSSTIKFVCPQLEAGEQVTQFSIAMSELAGPAGETGPVGYPQGEWNASSVYTKTGGTVPFVFYPKEKGGDDRYYLLKADRATTSAQSPSNEDYWTPFTQFEYLFVKMLMANWAMFGGDNGGVFYDRYLFSQYGNGDKYYSNYKDKMWNTGYPNDAYLSGEFVPNMYIDFYRGAIKTSKFSEPFTTIEKDDKWNYYPVVPTGNHTLKISANIAQEAIGEFTFRNRMIVMPSRADYPHYHEMSDGEHYTIFKEVGGNEYGLAWDVLKAYNNFDVVCSDKTLLTEPSSTTGYEPSNLSGGSYGKNDGWFLWHGMRSKMVLLAPSVMLKLRLQIRENETYWIIENSDDFIALDAQLLTLNESYATTSKINKTERFNKTVFKSDSSSPQVNLSINSYQPLLLAPRAMDYFRGNADDSIYFRFAYSYQNAIGGNGYMGDGVFKAMNPSDWYPN